MTAIIINTKIRLTSKESTPSIWLEGQKLAKGGIESGQVLYARFDKAERKVVATNTVVATTQDVKAVTVSRRRRNGREYPLIELRAVELSTLFDGVDKLRVAIKDGMIIIKAHIQHEKVKSRLDRFLKKLKNGDKLSIGSLFHGGGVMDRALHEGFEKVGVRTAIRVAVEIEKSYLESSLTNNAMLWDVDSIVVQSPLEDVDLSSAPQLEVVVAGIPCTGASLSGRSKNKLSCAEEHSSAGAMFFYALNFILATQPSVILIENVVPYKNTSSFMVIDSVLQSAGYTLQTKVFNGNDYGALENRDRLVAIATTEGLEISLDNVLPVKKKESSLSEILDGYPQDSERWKTYDYLASKEQRDIEAGKGFKRQLLDGTEGKIGTTGAGYMKARSTEPFLISPFNDGKSRLLSSLEHARAKGIPEDTVAGLSETIAHQVLGQSVIYPLFVAIGQCVGTQIRNVVDEYRSAIA